jgi:5-methylcytosine-specific restriction endonuclease McrA
MSFRPLRFATPEQRTFVYFRDDAKCHYCGTDISFNSFHADHIYPFSKGGKTNINNLVASCYMCNVAKHTMDYDKFKQNISQKDIDWRRKRFFAVKSNFATA